MSNAKYQAKLMDGAIGLVLNYFKGKTSKILSVGLAGDGIWLVADDDLEIASLSVVGYMLKHNLKELSHIKIATDDGQTYTLYMTIPGSPSCMLQKTKCVCCDTDAYGTYGKKNVPLCEECRDKLGFCCCGMSKSEECECPTLDSDSDSE